jgi:hypothetical protein
MRPVRLHRAGFRTLPEVVLFKDATHRLVKGIVGRRSPRLVSDRDTSIFPALFFVDLMYSRLWLGGNYEQLEY